MDVVEDKNGRKKERGGALVVSILSDSRGGAMWGGLVAQKRRVSIECQKKSDELRLILSDLGHSEKRERDPQAKLQCQLIRRFKYV
jgi:hypothetical protein